MMLEKATAENEAGVRKAKHDALSDAFHRKHVIYFGCVGHIGAKTLVKIGSTNDIKERSREHRKDYGRFDLIKVIESQTNRDFELRLLKHRKFRQWLYREPVKADGSTSIEVILVDADQLKSALHIAECKRKKYPAAVIRDGERRLTELQSDITVIKAQMQEITSFIKREVEAESPGDQEEDIREDDEAADDVESKQKSGKRKFEVSKEELIELVNIQKLPFVDIGRRFSVQASSIRKRCKVLGIEIEKRETQKTEKRKRPREKSSGVCPGCDKAISKRTQFCGDCVVYPRKFDVSKEILHEMVHIEKLSFSEIGRRFGVSDNAIRKRCQALGVETRKRVKRTQDGK